jgi:hypothetical protein
LYGLTDFIANFGGLLGLFLGVSILSIVEIVYFIAFRQLNEDKSPEKKKQSGESVWIDKEESLENNNGKNVDENFY